MSIRCRLGWHARPMLNSDGVWMFAVCGRCRLRGPSLRHENGTWAKDLWKAAKRDRNLFRERGRSQCLKSQS